MTFCPQRAVNNSPQVCCHSRRLDFASRALSTAQEAMSILHLVKVSSSPKSSISALGLTLNIFAACALTRNTLPRTKFLDRTGQTSDLGFLSGGVEKYCAKIRI